MSAVSTLKLFLVITMVCMSAGGAFSQTPHYLVTNDDHSQAGTAKNSATFYTISPTGNLTETANVVTGGIGWDSLGYAITRILISKDFAGNCVYLAEYGMVAGVSRYAVTTISVDTLKVVAHFKGSATDTVPDSFSNMGLAMYGSYLYANFTGPRTIGTYQRLAGCKLKFLGDVSAVGLNGGTVKEMVARKNILVVSFADGSIESFNTSSGMPVANGDLQYSTDYIQNGGFPEGADATSDAHYVIFGDGGGPAVPRAEVSDISSGKLTPTIVYSGLGSGLTAINVRLSPDETLLYLSEFSTGQVSANFFDKTTGVPTASCESAVLKGYRSQWVGTYTLQTKNTSGTGGVVYVAEPDTDIGVVGVTASGGTCSLNEAGFSPVYDHHTISMESIAVFPPRAF
jgi:hypothetical protein